MNSSRLDESAIACRDSRAVTGAEWHALFWLTAANAAGTLIAVLLLFPGLNTYLGELTYGRWMMVHMNLELYGWTSLPLIGFLFRAYGADRGTTAPWCRPMLWAWSTSLAVGCASWLAGRSTGKLFLDWSGYARAFFMCMLFALWFLLVCALVIHRHAFGKNSLASKAAQVTGLAVLLLVPVALDLASSSLSYPAINPASGGPTSASQLQSTLAVVLILLVLPFAVAPRNHRRNPILAACWIVLAAEFVLSMSLGHGAVSHHLPVQFLSLGSVLVWIPLIPAYYAHFSWNANTRRWRVAFEWWWAALVVTGWIFFLPGVLDRFKFTDGLVGHSFVAMAGFTSSFVVFLMVQLLGDDGWIFNRTRAFYLWQGGVLAYIIVMTIAGWYESANPAFTIVPGVLRNVLYTLRLASGLMMLWASIDWLIDGSAALRRPAPVPEQAHLLEAR